VACTTLRINFPNRIETGDGRLDQQDIDAGFMGRLSAADRVVLTEAMETRRFPDGADIVTQGDSTTDCFFLLEGRAMATVYAEDGRLVLLREIGQGSVFGEFAALDGGPRTADVIASGPVIVGRMSRDVLFACIERAPGIGRVLMSHLVNVIRLLGERIHEQTTLHVRERLLRELLRLGMAAAGGTDRATLSPAPTHAVLAANIGTHREAVTKQLSAFARLGLVGKVPGGLMLPSLRALEKEIARSIE
jgi:CRP-like cAMP-binding protein